jgi:DNA-binding beta-propeller fold protein YncE
LRAASSFVRRACLWRIGIVGAIATFCLLERPIQGTWEAAHPDVSDLNLARSGDFDVAVGSPFACAYPQQGALGATAGAETYSLDADIAPVRSIVDPFPSFNGVAVDPVNGRVVMSDSNRKSLLMYGRLTGSRSGEMTEPLGRILGPSTQIGFVAGVTIDPVAREMYAVSNDIEDVMVAFSYDARGNAPPRILAVPHGSWGLSLSPARNEIAVSVEHENAVYIYRRGAKGYEPPLRIVHGPGTGMSDPHGVHLDGVHNEILVASHGNFNGRRVANDQTADSGVAPGGGFVLPSITVYLATADGDARPLRAIQGGRTRLAWPMGIDVDIVHDEIAVANNGGNSVLIFRRTDNGDRAPVREIRGPRTEIHGPMGVSFDAKSGEIWVANFADHSAVVFDREAAGDVVPKRIIRNAPAGIPTGGFGNPMSMSFDTKRGEILVPN